jgi:hypothetical protein
LTEKGKNLMIKLGLIEAPILSRHWPCARVKVSPPGLRIVGRISSIGVSGLCNWTFRARSICSSHEDCQRIWYKHDRDNMTTYWQWLSRMRVSSSIGYLLNNGPSLHAASFFLPLLVA